MPASTSSMLDHALRAVRAGLPVMPLHSAKSGGRCTCGSPTCQAVGKHPRTKSGLNDASLDPKRVKAWWSKWPNANIAAVGGDNLCLDIDVHEADGLDSLETLIEDNGPLPHTTVAETGEYDGVRGQHQYFRVPEGRSVRTSTAVRPGIDIRASRGYWILPPSSHSSGVEYEWVTGTPELEERAEAPEWLLDLCKIEVEADVAQDPIPGFKLSKERRAFLEGQHEVPLGEQRLFLVATARALWRLGSSVQTIAQLLWEGETGEGGIQNSQWGESPWTEDHMFEIAADISSATPSTALEKDFDSGGKLDNDTGLAQRLVESFPSSHVIHAEDESVFYVWDTERKRFARDRGYLMKKQLIEKVVPELKAEASEAKSREAAAVKHRQAMDAQKLPRIQAALALAPQFCRVEPQDFNADPFVLACMNGALDLRTGELSDLDPQMLLTKRCRAEFDPKAKSRIFDRFLKQIVPDAGTREYLQRAFGYSLTGSAREQKFFFVYGRPGSGKGTLVDTFAYLMGSYGQTAKPETFMLQKSSSGSHSEELARLRSTRFVVSPEPEQGSKFAGAQLASLTGQDPIVARHLYQQSFEFYPEFKLWFVSNHMPRVGSTRSGVWRRMKVVIIDEEIKNPDASLRDQTMRTPEVLAAMLAWAAAGAQRWFEENYKTGAPIEDAPEIGEATQEFYEDEDQVGRFLSEYVVEQTGKRTRDHRVAKRWLFNRYEEWAQEQGIKMPKTIRAFGAELKQQGFQSKTTDWEGKTAECWTGIRLNEPYEAMVAKRR